MVLLHGHLLWLCLEQSKKAKAKEVQLMLYELTVAKKELVLVISEISDFLTGRKFEKYLILK